MVCEYEPTGGSVYPDSPAKRLPGNLVSSAQPICELDGSTDWIWLQPPLQFKHMYYLLKDGRPSS